MRTLILSDAHANAAALEAVLSAASFDRVLYLGDALDLGPHPGAVLDRLIDLADVRLLGNHDRLVLDVDPRRDATDSGARGRQWTKRRLSPAAIADLEGLSRSRRVDHDGLALRLHHGNFAPPATRDGVADVDGRWENRLHPDRDRSIFETLARRYPEPYLVHGHSHVPFVETVAGTTFVNPGSVSVQRSGWPADRARYATLERGEFSLESVAYDPARPRAALSEVGLPADVREKWAEPFDAER